MAARTWSTLVGGMCMIAGLTGCAGTPRVDAAGVERAVQAGLAPELRPERIDSVVCPADRVPEPGTRFSCEVSIADTSFSVDVAFDGPDGRITFAPRRAVVVASRVESDLASRLHRVYDVPGDKIDLDVDCGAPAVRVLDPWSHFDCAVTADGDDFVERVTVTDRAGNVTYRLRR